MSTPEEHRCGYVAIMGRPNAGKSTLLNKILGEKVSIVSHKPQTTRNQVVGIHNTPEAQVVLVDTPGHHEAWSPLNQSLVRAAEGALSGVDVVVLIVDAVPAVRQAKVGKSVFSRGHEVLMERIEATGKPCILCINKMDLIEPEWVLPVIEGWSTLHEFDAILPISALKGRAVDDLMVLVAKHMPVHPPFFPKDQIMDSTERFVCAEIIREKLFERLSKELPYSTAVMIEAFDESRREEQKPRVEIGARILVERKSQRGIVIGKGGSMLKAIGTDARKDIQKLLGCKVHLRLHVTVNKDWTKNPRVLRELGLG
jgi:GTP-binding protein Era